MSSASDEKIEDIKTNSPKLKPYEEYRIDKFIEILSIGYS